MSKDYYKILNLNENASHDEIKKSFRKLSMKYHPDKNNGDDKQFKEINEAYEILGDKDERKIYDFKRNSGIPFMNANVNGMPEMPNDMNEMFKMFFTQNSSGFNAPNVQIFRNGVPVHTNVNVNANMNKPVPIIKRISITLEQSYNGDKYPLDIERWIMEENIKKTEKETIYIDIPQGSDNNEIIILRNQGNIINENNKGDIKIFITVTNNTIFTRNGLELIINKTISLKEALCGFTFEIQHLNKKKFKINNEKGNIITPSYKKVIQNLGMKRQNHTGNMTINFNIDFPKSLTEKQVNSLINIL